MDMSERDGLSCNPNLTKVVINFPDKPWDWENGISGNTNLTKEIIDAFPINGLVTYF